MSLQDEHVERLELDDEPDLVVIQVYITSARRAYRLADHYRRRGAYVALGRPARDLAPGGGGARTPTASSSAPGRTPGRSSSPTSAPAVRSRSTARRCGRSPACRPIRRDLIKRHLYLVPNSIVVSRGCPHTCDFCYKEAFFEGGKGFYTQRVDRPWRRSRACPAATSTSWTTTCSATSASRPRSSRGCGGWGASGRRRGR